MPPSSRAALCRIFAHQPSLHRNPFCVGSFRTRVQQQLEPTTATTKAASRCFSSSYRGGGGGGFGGGNGSGKDRGGLVPYRLRRPEVRTPNNKNKNNPRGGRGDGSRSNNDARKNNSSPTGRLSKPKRVNVYANTTPYIGGSRDTRVNAITLFPGNFQDQDDAFDDEEDEDNLLLDSINTHQPDPEEVEWTEYVKEAEEKAQAQRLRRIELNKPMERVSEIDERGRSYGRGGRKTAQARVWIQPGFGEVVVNQRPLTEYFDRLTDREQILAPFVATETCGAFDVLATVKGGGLTGQAGAIRLGVARALNAYNPDTYRPALKFLGYLTRDARKVERKKVGHVKARKSPQWVRR